MIESTASQELREADEAARQSAPFSDTPEGRLRELTETGKSVRHAGRPIMTIIREALELDATQTDA